MAGKPLAKGLQAAPALFWLDQKSGHLGYVTDTCDDFCHDRTGGMVCATEYLRLPQLPYVTCCALGAEPFGGALCQWHGNPEFVCSAGGILGPELLCVGRKRPTGQF